MEFKLFLIGLGVLAYLLATRQLAKKNLLSSPLRRAAWHSLFWGYVLFSLLAIISATMGVSHTPPLSAYPLDNNHIPGLLTAGALFGVWVFFKAKKRPEAETEAMLKEDIEWSETIFSAVMLAAVVMYFVVQAFKIPSASMRSTLMEGDHLFVNKFIYGLPVPLTGKKVLHFKPVDRGDVIVFQFPSDSAAEIHCGGVQYAKDFVKRVVGMPGDRVEVRDGRVYINDKAISNDYYAQYTEPTRLAGPEVLDSPDQYQQLWLSRNLGRKYGEQLRDYFGPVTVPPDGYFVMGDNRDHSCDSRFWGPVPKDAVKGKAWFIYWPPSRMQGIR